MWVVVDSLSGKPSIYNVDNIMYVESCPVNEEQTRIYLVSGEYSTVDETVSDMKRIISAAVMEE